MWEEKVFRWQQLPIYIEERIKRKILYKKKKNGGDKAQHSECKWHKNTHSRERRRSCCTLSSWVPRVWYAWRHQILALSCLGYRAVAPDLRGYGDTEVPSSSFTSYTCFHVAGDIIALIDFLGVEQVFVVAHDFGAIIAWHLCLFRPERVKSFVSLGMPYLPRDPNLKPVETLRAMYGDNFYICKFQVWALFLIMFFIQYLRISHASYWL